MELTNTKLTNLAARVSRNAVARFVLATTLALVTGVAAVSAKPAPVTASQVFTVIVPAKASMNLPSNQTMQHDESNNNQTFSGQKITAASDSRIGTDLSISATPFVNSNNPASQRNVKLAMAVSNHSNGSGWAAVQAISTSDYASATNATVQAASSGPGIAVINLDVDFVTVDHKTMVPGSYVATVSSLITSKP